MSEKKKQITNFIATGKELEVYQPERDDELDELTDRFASADFIRDDESEENFERTVETCDEQYDAYYKLNCDDLESSYQSNGNFYEDYNQDYDQNQHCDFDRTNDFDSPNNFMHCLEPSDSQLANCYWADEVSCSFSGQPSTEHRPTEEENLTGLELVPYGSDDAEKDPPTRSPFKPEFDYDDVSQYKENILEGDQDEYYDDWLEIYKRKFRENFPELFVKKKKRKEKKVR